MLDPRTSYSLLNEEVTGRVEVEPRYRLTMFALGVIAIAAFFTVIGG